MPNLRGSEWLIIILLLVLLFGAKRLPDAARSMGRSLRIFKAETKGLAEDGAAPAGPAAAPGQSVAAPLVAPTAAGPLTPPSAAAPVAAPNVAGAPVTPAAPSPSVVDPRSEQPQLGGALTPQPPAQT